MPWWTPAMYAGVPFLALSHTQVLYPLTWVAAPLDPFFAHTLLIAVHLALAGLGMWLLLRTAGIGGFPALLGAVVFLLQGMFATRHGHPQFVATACWLPWAAVGVNLLTGTRSFAGAAVLAVATAMMVLAGHPSIYVYGYYFVGFWLLVRLRDHSWSDRARLGALFAAAFLVGIALASAQLLATAELSQFTPRAARPEVALARRLSHPVHLLRTVFPFATGTPIDGTYWSPTSTHFTAGTLYAGVPTLLLAAWGAVRTRLGRPLGVLVVLTLLVLFVPFVFGIAYDVLPGFRFSRTDRLSIVWFLSISVLAALGTRELLRTTGPLLPFGLGALLVGIGLAVVALVAVPLQHDLPHKMVAANGGLTHLHGTVAWASALWLAGLAWVLAARAGLSRRRLAPLLLVLVLVDLGSFFRHFVVVRRTDRLFRETPAITFLQEHLGHQRIAKFGGWRRPDDFRVFTANTPTVFGIDDLHGFGPMHLRPLDELLSAVEPGFSHNSWHVRPFLDVASLGSPTLDVLAARYVLALEPLEGLPLVHSGDLAIHENPGALPRVSFVRGWEVDPRAADRLAEGTVDPRRTVLLEAPAGVPRGPETGTNHAVLVARDLDRVVARKTGPDPGLVLFSEAWYPGWTYAVDGGEPRAVHRANVALQAAPVPAGDHEVVFAYRPTWLRTAGWTTSLGVLGLASLLLAATVRARRRMR